MGFTVMPKAALSAWITNLRQDYRVIAPKPVQDQHIFAEINAEIEIDLDYPTSILPPKKVLLPQREELIQFNIQENKIEPLLENHPTVILGVHTCDMHAISLLDIVFNQGFPDQHYLSRRENTTLVSIECLTPCNEHSFCKDMGTLSVPDKFDLHLTDLGDDYAIDIGSDKGANLLQGFDQTHEATDRDFRRINHIMSNKWAQFPYRLQADVTELPSLLRINYKSSLWDDLESRCLGCGMCTIVCPTCYCFDVLDEVDYSLSAGTRFRMWDSCQLNQFASVAGGHDFRPGHANRQRHRFLRKYEYQSVASGLVGCVGCGRCAQACLVNITPVDVLNKLHSRQAATSPHRRQEVSLL